MSIRRWLLISKYDANRIRRQMAGVLVGTRGVAFTQIFYEHLFRQVPELRPLFPINLAHQARKLLLTISAVMKNLDNDPELERLAVHLQKVHGGIYIQEGHIEKFLASLSYAFERVNGNPFPEHDWTTLRRAVFSVSALMIRAEGHPLRVVPHWLASAAPLAAGGQGNV